jgi:hypothetical protein
MSITSAPVDLHIPANPASFARGHKVIAVIRQLASRPRWSPERPHLKMGDSYLIPDGRRGYDGGSNWVHPRH